jgi:ATP-binding cassette subfamily B protein
MSGSAERRHFLAPEVIQTSAMDCGPATLKSVLEGFGRTVSYRKLREACQTEVDGTSIDTLEELASSFGLEAEQVLIPSDHLFLPETHALPAIAVTVGRDGASHFVVIWRTLGDRVQVMDPATGRHWLTRRELEQRLLHTRHAVPAGAFRAHAGSLEFLGALQRRLRALIPRASAARLLELACADASFRSLAALDAATRALKSLVVAKALPSRADRVRLMHRWLEQAGAGSSESLQVPESYWYASSKPDRDDLEGEEAVQLSGILLVRIRDRASASAPQQAISGESAPEIASARDSRPELVSEVRHAFEPNAEPPFRQFLRLLKAEGVLGPLLLAAAGALVATAAILEALILSGLLEIEQYLSESSQRLLAALAALCFMLLVTLADVPLTYRALRMGSRLETRLRIAFMHKLPRLTDRYFQSRPVSDMADRAHMVHVVRVLPLFALSLLRLLCSWLTTALGLVWLDPAGAYRVGLSALACLLVPLLAQRRLIERDARVRTLSGALSRCYFDALCGLGAIRAHAGQRNTHAEHEAQLSGWKRAGLSWAKAVTLLELWVAMTGAIVTGWLCLGYFEHNPEPASVLLFLYWALSFPSYGRELASFARQLPAFANVVSRLIEPLGALEVASQEREAPRHDRAPSIEFRAVTLQASGHTLLSELNLRIAPGEHVAIVGMSGAGKSSLLGLLLGFHRASQGELCVDEQVLSEPAVQALRRDLVWLDPTVALWNRSLLANLRYGSRETELDFASVLNHAQLRDLVGNLPRGLQTVLGESGGSLSGGEGQRVRFGRALLRSRANLVLLDEPFRGLDREQRRTFLALARRRWQRSTLLCVTHDLLETLEFPRVLVVSQGKIVEDGAPSELMDNESSHYSGMLRAERDLFAELDAAGGWRRIQIESARLCEARVERNERATGRSVFERSSKVHEVGAAE